MTVYAGLDIEPTGPIWPTFLGKTHVSNGLMFIFAHAVSTQVIFNNFFINIITQVITLCFGETTFDGPSDLSVFFLYFKRFILFQILISCL